VSILRGNNIKEENNIISKCLLLKSMSTNKIANESWSSYWSQIKLWRRQRAIFVNINLRASVTWGNIFRFTTRLESTCAAFARPSLPPPATSGGMNEHIKTRRVSYVHSKTAVLPRRDENIWKITSPPTPALNQGWTIRAINVTSTSPAGACSTDTWKRAANARSKKMFQTKRIVNVPSVERYSQAFSRWGNMWNCTMKILSIDVICVTRSLQPKKL